MKTILKPLLYLLFLATLSSCAQEQIGRELMISGKFAQINESGLTSLFLEFDDGQFSIWKSDESYPFAEKRIWHCESRAFYKTTMRPYSIIDGIIVIGNNNSGKIELIDDVLHFNGDTFGVMEGFIPSAYSRITVNPEEIIDLTYAAESVRVPVYIENPIPGGVLSATTTAKWISDLRVEDGFLLFNTASTKENRDAVITLSYTHAENLNVTVTQAPSTFIRITDPDRTIGYEASSYNIEYTIDNPIASSILTVNCSNNWIQDLEIQDGRVNFNVTENNTGNERKAYFYFQYEGAPDVMFTLTQKWDAATILTSPASAEFEYTGGQGDFIFEIQNPRQGVSIAVQSQASWISNVTVNGNTVTYQVAECSCGAHRTGNIKLSYGSYATVEFPVVQKGTGAAVDLGLSVYWATRNLSANGLCPNPEDYGDYFAWGETAPKDNFDWSTYKLCNGSSSTLTRYNTADGKTEFLDYGYEDDAARMVLGGKWRIPTDAEWTELRKNCTWTWTDNYNGTGVAGRIATSKVEGYTDKSIFLPAAGNRRNSSLYSVGISGRYWSSTSNTEYLGRAFYVGFSSESVSRDQYGALRSYGQSVRPVSE